jgi:hypothetical protein
MINPPINLAGQDIAECCKKVIPLTTDDLLLSKLQALVPHYPVRHAYTGEEWYKLGGVVDMHGQRVAYDLIEWVERTYIECGQNLQVLIEHSLDNQLLATKQTGKTLYFVVQTGELAQDFILIEIDKTHEVSDRMLIDEANLPADLEEFIDPIQRLSVENFSFGQSRYTYKRKTDVALFMEVITERHVSDHPVQRFMDDWNRSSASQKQAMSEDWIIRPYRHTGRFGEQIVNIELINTNTAQIPHLEDFADQKGNALNNILNRFDRQIGYPMAWFFYMTKAKGVSPHCAEAVFKDLENDFAYLPARDEAVLRDWIAKPYNV